MQHFFRSYYILANRDIKIEQDYEAVDFIFFLQSYWFTLFLFNEKEEISQPIHGIDNSVYIHKADTPRIDSIAIYHNRTASVL